MDVGHALALVCEEPQHVRWARWRSPAKGQAHCIKKVCPDILVPLLMKARLAHTTVMSQVTCFSFHWSFIPMADCLSLWESALLRIYREGNNH